MQNNATSPSSSSSTTVVVTNISPSANEKTLSEFFSFCGKITSLKLTKFPNKGGEAVVVFETESAAKTALLLTNALIADRPITVAPFFEEVHSEKSPNLPETGETVELKEQISHKTPASTDNTHTSVIASLIAAGYILGNDALNKARAIDEENQISSKIISAATVAKDKMTEIDQQLHITETISNIGTTITTKVNDIDQTYHVSDNVNAAIKTVSQTIGTQVAMAKEVPAVQTATTTVNQVGENIKTMITPTVDALKANVEEIQQQTNQIIAEKLQNREGTSVESAAPITEPASTPPQL